MSKAADTIPPPPATGGSHTWDPKGRAWVTTAKTIQLGDPEHPDNKTRAAEGEPAADAVKDN